MMDIRRRLLKGWLLWMLLCPLLAGCTNDDDMIAIFTGKSWKLTYIAAEGTNKQYDFWGGNETAFQNSMDALKNTANFVIGFEGNDLNGIAGGTFSGRGILYTFDGTWSADGESNALSLSLKDASTERDVLASAFMQGLRNAYRYSGDSQNLYIYYKEGQTVKFMAFRPQ